MWISQYNKLVGFFLGKYDDSAVRALLHPVNQEASILMLDFQDFSQCFEIEKQICPMIISELHLLKQRFSNSSYN